MKDYSVLEGLDNNFMIELRCAYDRGYRHGRDDEWAETKVKESETKDEGYNRGLESAWSCAKRIMSMPLSDQEKIFNMQDERAIMDAYSAEEAIDILKRYDEKQKQTKKSCKTCIHEIIDSDGDRVCNLTREKYEECINPYIYHEPKQTDDEIEVGDEIVYSDPLKGEEKGIVMGVCSNWVEVKFLKSWNCIGVHKDSVKKTGRHFEQLDEILETMKNE